MNSDVTTTGRSRTLEAVSASGGVVVQPVGADAPDLTARFRDPGGNVIGVYQERSR